MSMKDAFKEVFNPLTILGVRSESYVPDSISKAQQNTAQNQNEAPTSSPNAENMVNRQTLYSWVSKNKLPHNGIDPKVQRSLLIVGIILGIILFVMQEYGLIFAVLSMVFVSYVITLSPSVDVNHEITNLGILYEDEFYPWSDLKFYFFTEKMGIDILGIDRLSGSRLLFLISQADKKPIHDILYSRIPYTETPPKDALDDMYRNVLSKFTSPSA